MASSLAGHPSRAHEIGKELCAVEMASANEGGQGGECMREGREPLIHFHTATARWSLDQRSRGAKKEEAAAKEQEREKKENKMVNRNET